MQAHSAAQCATLPYWRHHEEEKHQIKRCAAASASLQYEADPEQHCQPCAIEMSGLFLAYGKERTQV